LTDEEMASVLEKLHRVENSLDHDEIVATLRKIVPEFAPNHKNNA
jgi:hypothetical protein